MCKLEFTGCKLKTFPLKVFKDNKKAAKWKVSYAISGTMPTTEGLERYLKCGWKMHK